MRELSTVKMLATPGRSTVYQKPQRPYLRHGLRAADARSYSAAGLLPYRASADGGVDVLLGRQSGRGKGASRRGTWCFIGGKRDPGEDCAIGTAAREVQEESMGFLQASWVESTLHSDPKVLWYPTGGYAIHLAQIDPENAKGDAVASAVCQLRSTRSIIRPSRCTWPPSPWLHPFAAPFGARRRRPHSTSYVYHAFGSMHSHPVARRAALVDGMFARCR